MSNENMNHLLSQAMRQQIPDGVELDLPPKSFIDMQAEMVAFEPGQSLTVRFPVLERYHNPMKMMQGGFIVEYLTEIVEEADVGCGGTLESEVRCVCISFNGQETVTDNGVVETISGG